MNIPVEMQEASAFEFYVWVHQSNRTLGEIRAIWGKSFEEIRAALDKGYELGWQYIPRDELPEMRDPRPFKRKRIPMVECKPPQNRVKMTAVIQARYKAIYADHLSGKSNKEIAETYGMHQSWITRIIQRQKLAEQEAEED